MNYRIVLLLGKIWIITALIKSVFTFWMIGFSNRVWLSIVMMILHILVGTSICIYASKRMSNEQTKLIPISDTPIHPFFQIVKLSTIVALGFQLIAAVIIAFFYCLKREFEATLFVIFISGFAIVAIVKAIKYYRDYTEQPERPESCTISVGMFSQNPVLEIYIKTHDGCIPRFYIREHEEKGASKSKFNACIRLRSNKYYTHMGAEGILSAEQKTQLIEYLESGVGAYKNWHRLIDSWNSGNDNTILPYNLEMPNY